MLQTAAFAAVAALLPPLVAALPTASPLAQRDVSPSFAYGTDKIRGVNIGGWLVLEPWITPSLFTATGNDAIIDEWTFGSMQDYDTALAALTTHWDTWITETDFANIAAAGLNHVRIPIGYWAYDVSDGEPYVQGQAAYLEQAIGWARNHGLKVMVDLHGVPGSQNGYDNSGKKGDALWATNTTNYDRTKSVIQTLALKYGDSSYNDVVTILQLINEPATYLNDQLKETTMHFYYDGYGTARYPWVPQGSGAESNLVVSIHDGFQPLSTFDDFMPAPSFVDVLLDTHNYQVFADEYVAWDEATHISQVCAQAANYAGAPLWLVVGEWSLAITDCATWLNGRNVGARYDGTYAGDSTYVGSCDGWSGSGTDFASDYKDFLRKYWDIQTQTYENNAQGWIFWAWKTESAAEWSYSTGLSGGWIPQDPTQHTYSYDSTCS
ncbi:hypothetical protein Q5752_003157 [Cryptotrichosporon argae]